MGPAGQVSDETETLLTGEAVALDVRPASFILRAAGALIDAACYFGLFVVALLGLGLVTVYLPMDEALVQAFTIASLVVSIVIVPTVVETLWRGRSVGKLVIGARIVRDDGGSASFRHALIRALTGVIEIYMTVGGIAIIVGLVHRRSKRLGDLLAGTYAQHERVPVVRTTARPLPPELEQWAAVADVARMPDPLARRIAQFLANAPGMSAHARERIAAGLASEAETYVSPRPWAAPETFLAGVAAIRREREYAALTGAKQRYLALTPLHRLPHGFPDR